MVEILQQLMNALMLGCIYCLIASGLTLVYGIMGVPNFAQGNIYMLGSYATFFFSCIFFQNYWCVIILAVIFMGIFGIIVERLCFRPVRDSPHVNSFVVALGLLLVIEGIIVVCFGADYKEVSPPWRETLEFLGVSIKAQRVLVIVGTIIVMLCLEYFLKRTKLGMILDAMSQNRELALMGGVNVNRMSQIAFVISTGLAGIGGALMAPISFVYPEMGMAPLLIAFAAIIFGGMGSLPGAVLGSFIMAFTQVFSTQYFSAVVSDIGIFGIMIGILIFRPTGIMGGRA